MRDNNDNNVDDNLEHLAILGGIAHFKGQQQALQQSARQAEEVRRLRRSAERDISARKAEEARIRELPQCPICGGRLEGQFRKCRHCTSDLSWIGRFPCEPGKELELQDRLVQEQQLAEALAEVRRNFEAELLRLPDKCPRCSNPRPRLGVHNADQWANSMSNNGCCHKCWRQLEKNKKIAKPIFDMTLALTMVLVAVPLVVVAVFYVRALFLAG